MAWVTIAAIAAAVSVVGGCGNGSPDQQVHDKLNAARVAASGGEQGPHDALSNAQAAVAISDASTTVQAQAKAALGQLHYDVALDALREIDRRQLEASRLSLDIAELGRQIGLSNVLVQGYQQLDPKNVRADIEKKIADAQGGPDKPLWIAQQGKSAVPTLSALSQQISALQGQIAQKEAQVKQLDQQRMQIIEEADKLGRQSDAAKGQQSVDLFKQASDARRKASDISTQMEVVNASIVPLQKSLGIAQGQQQILQTYVKELQEQAQTLDAGWKAVQQQMAAQLDLAKQIATADALAAAPATQGAPASQPAEGAEPDAQAAGKSVVAKAKAMADVSTQIEDLSKTAADDLDNAVKAFGEAFTVATNAERELRALSTSPNKAYDASKTAFTLQLQVISPQQYKLAEARALRALGSLHTARAANLSARIKLRDLVGPAMQAASIPAPQQLAAADLDKQFKDAVAAADEAYKTADERLTDVAEAPASSDVAREIQKAARVAQIFVQYGRSQLALLAGDVQHAQEYDTKAREAVKVAADGEATLPALPGSLQSAVPAPATQPAAAPEGATTAPAATTQPATAPATAPAPGA